LVNNSNPIYTKGLEPNTFGHFNKASPRPSFSLKRVTKSPNFHSFLAKNHTAALPKPTQFEKLRATLFFTLPKEYLKFQQSSNQIYPNHSGGNSRQKARQIRGS